MEIQNCTTAAVCSVACKSITDKGGNCDIQCCDWDMCNSMSNASRPFTVAPYPSMTGTRPNDLSCYLCKTGSDKQLDKLDGSSCDQPSTKQCGKSKMSSCARVKYQRKDPKNGEIINFELRNCTDIYSCPMACKYFNATGDVLSCNAQCCQDNLCNGDAIKTTPSHPRGGRDPCALVNIIT